MNLLVNGAEYYASCFHCWSQGFLKEKHTQKSWCHNLHFIHARDSLYSNSAVITDWLQSLRAQMGTVIHSMSKYKLFAKIISWNILYFISLRVFCWEIEPAHQIIDEHWRPWWSWHNTLWCCWLLAYTKHAISYCKTVYSQEYMIAIFINCHLFYWSKSKNKIDCKIKYIAPPANIKRNPRKGNRYSLS